MFGIKIKWPDGWIWVPDIQPTTVDFSEDTPVMLFDTEEQAEATAEIFRKPGKEHNVLVMPYEE